MLLHMPHLITIDASPSQLSKLRRGHSVRIKKGSGFNVVVDPDNYNIVSRAFNKNKGVQIKLSQDEVDMNKGVTPEQHTEYKRANPEIAGQGIFGKKFDKLLKKGGIKKIAYTVGDVAKPFVKEAISQGLNAGAQALAAYQPELAPLLPVGVKGMESLSSSYLDHPGKLQGVSNKKQQEPSSSNSLNRSALSAYLASILNSQQGTNYDYMNRAGLDNMRASNMSSDITRRQIDARTSMPIDRSSMGSGLRVSHQSKLLGHTPPALVSQPMGANFQMSHFMPVQYQRSHSGMGLYAGKGLYI